jgi:hypothetical protein
MSESTPGEVEMHPDVPLQEDPLDPLHFRLQKHLQQSQGSAGFLAEILQLWLTDQDDSGSIKIAPKICKAAVASLINVSELPLARLFARRQKLVRALMQELNAIALPTPPSEGVPGLVGYRRNLGQVVRIRFDDLCRDESASPSSFSDLPDPFSPSDLRWQSAADVSIAEFGDWELLESDGSKFINHPLTPGWVASAFRGLAEDQANQTGELECAPSAFNLLGVTPDRLGDAARWSVLGYAIPKSSLLGQAFVKSGSGLVPERVPIFCDHLWRIGYAISDWLGLIVKSSSLPDLGMRTPAWLTISNREWAQETLLRVSLHRLRGIGRPHRVTGTTDRPKMPASVERVLRRLEQFPIAENGSDRMRFVLAALVEDRALRSRTGASRDFDPRKPGGAVALLARLTQASLPSDSQFAQELPTASRERFQTPRRRTTMAWLLVSDRLEMLNGSGGLQPGADVEPALSAIAAGARLLSIEAELRAQALEQWSSLNADQRDQLLESDLDLTAWRLDADAVFNESYESSMRAGSSTGENRVNDSQVVGARDSVRLLLFSLRNATEPGLASGWSQLNRITPLGSYFP